MKRNVLTFGCILLGSTACMFQAPGADEEVLVFSSTLGYLRAHPANGTRSQCFEQKIIKHGASRASLLRANDIYAFVNDDFQKVMKRCSDERALSPVYETRHQFYQPLITNNGATIQVDTHCGKLCGRGMTYKLSRNADVPEWHVTSSTSRWIS
jgi:hypothetical protein